MTIFFIVSFLVFICITIDNQKSKRINESKDQQESMLTENSNNQNFEFFRDSKKKRRKRKTIERFGFKSRR